MEKKERLGKNAVIVFGWLRFRYRFFRRSFTSLRRGIVAGVFLCTCAVSFFFSPRETFPHSFYGNVACPSVSVEEMMSDEEELKDSAPLFLPTRWNAFETNLYGELAVERDENLGFGGVFFLDENAGVLRKTKIFSEENCDVLGFVSQWELTYSFGERKEKGLPAPVRGIRMSVFDYERNRRIFLSEAKVEGLYDASRLWEPVEIVCYGEVVFRRFSIVHSSGNADIDRRILAFVKMWSTKNLREEGRFCFRVGR